VRSVGAGTLLAAGIVLAGLNLRIAVASVPPVLDEIQRDLGVSSAVAGLLTSIPVLCFGLLAPAAPALVRRYGAERVLLGALAALTFATLLRGIPSLGPLFAATAAGGAAVAVANVGVPAIVKEHVRAGTGRVMGLYVGALGAGAALAAGLTPPLADAFGGRWSVALAVWALPAAIAAIAVGAVVDRGDDSTEASVMGNARALLRDSLAWQVTGFMALQSLVFYAGLAWLPSFLRDNGYTASEAGVALSLYLLLGIPASLVVPPLAVRMRDQRVLAAATAGVEAAAIAGLLLAPDAAFVWAALFGIGQGATFSLALTLIVLRTPHAGRAAQLSAMAQTIGYTLAAAGPIGLALVHDASGGWNAPFAVLFICAAILAGVGLLAGRVAFVGGDARVVPS
jgi:CP family cyanate transporter-like MFS transporter